MEKIKQYYKYLPRQSSDFLIDDRHQLPNHTVKELAVKEHGVKMFKLRQIYKPLTVIIFFLS